MNLINNRLLDAVTKFFFLNMTWILFCLPIITVPASTTATFAMAREWRTGQSDSFSIPVFFNYFTHFFKKSMLLSYSWLITIIILSFYFYFFLENQITILLPLIITLLISYFLASIYLIPVLVHYKTKGINIIKFSIIFGYSQLGTTLKSAMILLASLIIVNSYPMMMLISGSITIQLIYNNCHNSFEKVENRVIKNNY